LWWNWCDARERGNEETGTEKGGGSGGGSSIAALGRGWKEGKGGRGST